MVQLNPVDGAHEKLFPPLTDKTVESPGQMAVLLADAVGGPGEVIVIVIVPVPATHAPDAITEYVVVTEGDATGLAQVVQLNPVEGDHEKLLPPLTDKVVVSPGQTEVDVAETVGAAVEVTKCAIMLSVWVRLTYTAESLMLGSGV